MPRRLTLIPRELGKLELYLIYNEVGVWESYWRPLQDHPFTAAFTHVSKTVMEAALVGWTKPLVNILGIPPEGALRVIPEASRECENRRRCPLYIAENCRPLAKNMPWCFEPVDVGDLDARRLATEAIELWREGVYIIVVREDT